MDKLIYRVSAFSSQNQGGNEAGVVLDTKGLEELDMQSIAKKVGYSETAFLLPSQKADYKLKYFSPTTEVDLCGHATIATFNLLRNLDMVNKGSYTIQTNNDLLTITIEDDYVMMDLSLPKITQGPASKEIAEVLNLNPNHIKSPQSHIISTGIPEIFIEVDTLETLHTIKPNIEAIKTLSVSHDAKGLYVFTRQTSSETAHAQGRNFLPALGIDEESATGTAAGSLGVYFHAVKNIKKTHYQFEQGYNLNKPSRLEVHIESANDTIQKVRVGGSMRFIDKIIKHS